MKTLNFTPTSLNSLPALVLLCVSLKSVTSTDITSTDIMDAKQLASTISTFSSKFCNELDKTKSVVSSPFSAEVLLALLTLGTTEPSHSELLKSLGFSDDDTIRSAFSAVSSKLKLVKGITLDIANKIYIKEGGYELLPGLQKDAVSVFDADFQKLNFVEGAKAAAVINNWVEQKTHSRIKDLISGDDLNDDTRLVLVNALYFKGSWKKQFKRENTHNKPFHVNAAVTVDIPTMYKEDDFLYGECDDLGVQLLKLPYEGDQASMLIVLPTEIEGLDAVLQKLAGGFDLMGQVDKMYKTKVQVYLPKFKIETEIDLNSLLPKLGIKQIFTMDSGLTKILDNEEPLYVSKAIQKAFIEVNEEGAEAAAATGMVMMLRCARMSPQFRADRPFLYVLSAADHTTLFVGNYRGNNE